MLTLPVVATLLTLAAPAPRVIDLGHPIAASDPSFEGPPAYEYTALATIDKDAYAEGKFTIAEHFGTHVDAPSHFAKGGWSVDQIPVDRLYRPGVRIDVTAQVAKDADYRVTVADLHAFERQHGPIAEGTIVLIATGWDSRWPDRARVMNETNGVKHFPGLSAEADAYLARDRKVTAIGIDSPSIDYGPSADFPAHEISLRANVYHVENMAHLTALPAKGFTVVVAPIDLVGGTGGPARVFAVLEN